MPSMKVVSVPDIAEKAGLPPPCPKMPMPVSAAPPCTISLPPGFTTRRVRRRAYSESWKWIRALASMVSSPPSCTNTSPRTYRSPLQDSVPLI